MKRLFLVPALAIAAVFVAPAAIAQAHVGSVVAACDGLTVNLTNYNAHARNVVEITVDETASFAQVFGRTFHKVTPWNTDQANTWTITVTAGDDPTGSHGWTFSKSGTQAACATQSPTTSPSTSTPCPPGSHQARCNHPTPSPTATSTPCPPGSHQARCYRPTPSSTAASSSSSSQHIAAAPAAAVCSSKGLACTGGFNQPALYAGVALILIALVLFLAAGFRTGPKHRSH